MYPGAALTTLILRYASKHGRLPSEVYQHYLANKFDYHLIFAYEGHVASEEEKAMEDARRGGPKRPADLTRRGFGSSM